MQWYAFHEEPTGGKDEKGTQKKRLLNIFGKWCGSALLSAAVWVDAQSSQLVFHECLCKRREVLYV